MSKQRFTPEFKDEAVRQITERGYAVTEVSQRLGVSAHSLYKWVKAVKPDKTEQQTQELVEAKGAILKLRAQLRRTEEDTSAATPAASISRYTRCISAFIRSGAVRPRSLFDSNAMFIWRGCTADSDVFIWSLRGRGLVISLLLVDWGVITGAWPKSAYLEQSVQFPQRVRRDAW